MGIRLLYKMMNVNKLYPKLSEVVSVDENQSTFITLVCLSQFPFTLLLWTFSKRSSPKKSTDICMNLEI